MDLELGCDQDDCIYNDDYVCKRGSGLTVEIVEGKCRSKEKT